MTADPSLLVESDRAVRRALCTLEHMNSENTQEWDRTIKTFSRPRYELPDGRIIDGHDAVMAYWHEGRSSVPDQRNQLIGLEVCDGGQVLLHFHLRGTPAGRDEGFAVQLWAVFDFDEDDLMTNERVFMQRPGPDEIAGTAPTA